MRDLHGKVAVVTGGASGIGKAMATRFAAEKMKVVLADVEQAPLEAARDELAAAGAEVLAVRADVSNSESVDELAARTFERFGVAHVICNNAGVGGGAGPLWSLTRADWEWTMGVNLWGVIHGVRAFVPKLIAQGEGHVVNTASIAGLLTPPVMGPYVVTKHAVVALSEVLAKDLILAGSNVKVSVLCPGFVKTRIAESQRNRPAHLSGAGQSGAEPAAAQMVRAAVEAGIEPAIVAGMVVEAIQEERFYVLPHQDLKGGVKHRMDDILSESYPRLPPPFKA